MYSLLTEITPPAFRQRLETLRDEQSDLRVLSWMLRDQFVRWAHTVGVCKDNQLRACVPPFPPEDLMALTNSPDLPVFLWTGLQDAEQLITLYEDLKGDRSPTRPAVLDFGCGCGRVSRFLGSSPHYEVHACDVNQELVHWCQENLAVVHTAANTILPPMPYADGTFDFVFSVSIFTHLPEASTNQWLTELHRILAPGGLCVVTTHGMQALTTIRDSAIHQKMFALTPEDATNIIDAWEARPFVFIPYKAALLEKVNAGDAYGSVFIRPEYIRDTWGRKGFSVLRHLPGGLRGWQDIVVLQRLADS